MRYLPQTSEDIQAMCEAIGVDDVEGLFATVPEALRLKRELDIGPALDEMALERHMHRLAAKNVTDAEYLSFLGAGLYSHHIPSAIPALALRSEFATCYTPYQPEISQGTLTAIFEFQTMVAGLTGMEVANASLYDGAHSAAEAVLMCLRIATPRRGPAERQKVVVSGAVHPEYIGTIQTYMDGINVPVVEVPWGSDGTTSAEALAKEAMDAAVVVVGYPNFFGCVEPLAEIIPAVQASGARVVVAIPEAMSMGLLKPAGSFGADVVVGEGQSFGIPVSYGGPGVGFFATRKEHVRQIPGRLAGRAVDSQGRDGFVLTLSTREQHIRRGKATSNVCTNQGLFALMMTMYLSLKGPQGLRAVAEDCFNARSYAAEKLAEIPGVTLPFSAPGFNELVIDVGPDAASIYDAVLSRQVVPGVQLSRWHCSLKRCLLLAFTEMNAKEDIDKMVEILDAEMRGRLEGGAEGAGA